MDVWALFERHQERKGLRPRSIEKRMGVCRDLDRWLRTHHDCGILAADSAGIEQWLDSKGEIAANTRASYISAVHGLFTCMIQLGICVSDPSVDVVRPKVVPGLPRPIADADLEVALKYAPPRERAMLALAAYAGLRCQEISFLKTEDILWSSGLLRVAKDGGKGGRERIIPLHDQAVVALKAYGIPKQGYFFRNTKGRKYTPDRVSQICCTFLESAGIPATTHQLRHWFGTKACRAGDLRAAQELLGHSDPRVTAVYTRVEPEDLRRVVASLSL